MSGNKVGNEVLLPTLNDPENTLVLTADANGGFEIYAGRTDETFFVDSLLSSAELNLNSGDLLTVVKGNEFFFDIDSSTFEDQLVYSGPQILWGDMNWLSIDETGLLSGLVPLDFQNGAAEFFYDNGWQTNTINSVNFLSAWDSASWDEPVILLQPNTWSEQLQPIYFNSTDEDIIFGDALIESKSLKPGGVNTFTQDYFDISKEGLGILAYGSQFDDYFDFSGYSEDDFDYIDPNSGVYVSTLQLTVGNDVFIAPEIELDGKFVGQMSARRYFDDHHYGQNGVRQLDLDEGLLFEFLGDGAVLAHDTANGYVTQGFNVGNIQTSMFTDDTVIGDDGASKMSSQGGVDTFIGKGGRDYFQIRYRDNDEIEDRQINIFEYESGETVQISDFGFTQNYANEYKIGYDTASNKTFIKLNTEMVQDHLAVTIDGQWKITGEVSAGQGVYDTDNSDGWLKFRFTEVWNETQDGILVVDGYARDYDYKLVPLYESDSDNVS